ncbi:hypothetical protein J5226_05255 [Lysobacter sp. K5869]|uniref:hypothetical protein n=1 Tax=Lysobacter sp. K5869 TaxID=2820808 RepID=UPI001C0627E2|nr:hypothetical protein [Lysobacter sp. K5869]QWP77820.1 hypothetical protein J5226_05255 [Lysobacter sp. K5869]
MRAHTDALSARGGASDRFDLALLLPLLRPVPDNRPDAGVDADANARRAAFVSAADLPGRQALVAWMQALDCLEAYLCDAQAPLARAQRLEPDNAAVWLLAMDWPADRRTRPEAADTQALLARAANAPRHDDHLQAIGRETLRALRAASLPAPNPAAEAGLRRMLGADAALPAATVIDASLALLADPRQKPQFHTLVAACSADRALAPDAPSRAPCLAALSRMADSDSLVSRETGTVLMLLLTRGGPDAARWHERQRRWQWLRANAALSSPALILAFRERGQASVLQAELDRRGQGRPPPGWPDEATGPNDADASGPPRLTIDPPAATP